MRPVHAALEAMEIPEHRREALAGKVVVDGEREEAGGPRRLFPVFRDQDELPASGDLSAQLKEALAASRHLVVFCSPASAASEWVGKEVAYFREVHDGDPVLLVMVGGERGAEVACFREELGELRERSNYVDLRPGGEGLRRAVQRLAAPMMGVGLNELVRREVARRARRIATVVASVLLAGYGAWELWGREIQTLHAQEQRVWGEPEGIGDLSAAEAARRPSTVRLTKRGRLGKVYLLEKINGRGLPWAADDGSEFHDRERRDRLQRVCVTRFDYRGGELWQESHLNAEGQTLYQVRYSPEGADGSKTVGSIVLAEGGRNYRVPTGAAYVNNVWSDDGLLVEQRYERADGGAVFEKSDGGFGRRYEYEDGGRVVWVSILDERGEVLPDPEAPAVARFEGEESAAVPGSQAFYNRRREKVPGAAGVHEIRYQYDGYGNREAEYYFDGSGRPALSHDGVGGQVMRYGEHGEKTGEDFVGLARADGVESGPVRHKALGVFGVRYTYGDGGRIDRFWYVDERGEAMMSTRRFAGYEASFDAVKREERIEFFDADDVVIAQEVRVYDERALLVEVRYLKADGKTPKTKRLEIPNEVRPVLYSGIRYEYSHLGEETAKQYLDAWGEVIEFPPGVDVGGGR